MMEKLERVVIGALLLMSGLYVVRLVLLPDEGVSSPVVFVFFVVGGLAGIAMLDYYRRRGE